MRRALLSVLLATTTLVAGPAQADEFQLWNFVAVTGTVDPEAPSVAYWVDLHARRGSGGTVLIARPAIGYALSRTFTVHAGYAWVPNFQVDNTINEHRFWQQLIAAHKTDGRVSLQSRTRFEFRFRPKAERVGLRAREFVRVSWQPSEDLPIGPVVWDELFIGLNETDWGAEPGFDQNRLFAGAFYQASPRMRIEAGYLRVDGAAALNNLLVSVFVKGPSRKGDEG